MEFNQANTSPASGRPQLLVPTEVSLAGELLAARLARVPGGHVLRDQVPPHVLPRGEVGLAFEAFLRLGVKSIQCYFEPFKEIFHQNLKFQTGQKGIFLDL